jgi:phosphoglucomutase
MMHYLKNYEYWKQSKHLDKELRTELEHLTETEIKDAFSLPIEFGTGGLRGKMGVGIAYINVHTIMQATEGFAQYLKKHFKEGSVVISYDNRKDSKAFALKAALVLSNHGIKTLLFSDVRPTPVLSFAVRHFKCIGGIMITASHNPKEDNGFKAYNHTGAQINLVEAEEIIEYASRIEDIFSVALGTSDHITYIDSSFDDIYLNAIKGVNIHPKKHDIKIIYSPLHGTGGKIIPKVLGSLGYDVIPVEKEMVVDPHFTYTQSSNPEQEKAYINSLILAKEVSADMILVTDPDADRLGVAVKHQGSYTLLTGNQTAAIELFYILTEQTKLKTLKKDGIVYTTVVTSEIIKAIAQSFQLKVIETLTGFKFIGEQAELNDAPFIFGCEESYGSLIIDEVRDKDAVQACMLLSEIGSNIYPNTLVDYLDSIYQTYGYYKEAQDNFFFRGVKGKEVMNDILKTLRQQPLHIKGFALDTVIDYQMMTSTSKGTTTTVNLPASNVITYIYSNQKVTLRPSGTEPKLKLYYGIKSETDEQSTKILKTLQEAFNSFLGEYV